MRNWLLCELLTMSGGQQGEEEPFLEWLFVVRSALLPLSPPDSTCTQPRTCDLAIIRAGVSCVPSCSRVRRLVGSNSVSAKIHLPIWLPSKLNFSCEVCHSAPFFQPI